MSVVFSLHIGRLKCWPTDRPYRMPYSQFSMNTQFELINVYQKWRKHENLHQTFKYARPTNRECTINDKFSTFELYTLGTYMRTYGTHIPMTKYKKKIIYSLVQRLFCMTKKTIALFVVVHFTLHSQIEKRRKDSHLVWMCGMSTTMAKN